MKRQTLWMRAALLLLALISTTMMWADQVTAEQAREQALAFVKNRLTANGRRLAPGTTPQLKLDGQVSGLYVFNVAADGGFVIVSNDDATTPILGFSDNGAIDVKNMPDNMRAWLQGYADEIAWRNAHPAVKASRVMRREGTAVKTAIAPLLTTTWNQDAPYNNLCPYYGINEYNQYVFSLTKDAEDYEHCATGCAATAMAQVMNYHEWPINPTKVIPTYQWRGTIDMPVLPVTPEAPATAIFDWANMKDSYAGTETDATADAIATLMQYCGYSIKMAYGPESGAMIYDIATALKEYFNYNNTTQHVQRSRYSYANWIELIYHELTQNRPVLYGGQSSGGGHAFVCDGYQGEDFFHINWGWAGQSDSYFKLSALDPNEQGIGGSSSQDGFHSGQEAVIGVQKSTDTGTVAEIATANINLSLNSITFSENPTQGQEMTAYINMTNNSNDDYDGDIGIRLFPKIGNTGDDEDWDQENFIDFSNSFLIPANSNSIVCELKFTLTDAATYGVFAYHVGETATTIAPMIMGTPQSLTEMLTPVTIAPSTIETTDNITLTQTLTVDTEESTSNPAIFKFYGPVLNGQYTLTNPETDKNYNGAYWITVAYSDDGGQHFNGTIIDQGFYVTIPANSSKSIPITIGGIPSGLIFVIDVSYRKNGNWADEGIVNYYVSNPGFTKYNADGTSTTKKATSEITVGEGVLAVNLMGSGVTSVIKTNGEPNCVYIVADGETVPAGLTNVITYDGNTDEYTAETITLSDNHGFSSPVDFTAQNIEFTYQFTTGADGSNGWNTIMLPFNVTSVTANGEAIDWFHNGSDAGKNFWVKKFVSDANNQVYFDYAEEMQANTPYIVAFPGGTWGEKWDLSGKTIKFIGTNATISSQANTATVTGANYRFIGSMTQATTTNIYSLNETGNQFVLNASSGSAPFRAYFKPGIFDRTVTSLGIGNIDGALTGITDRNVDINNSRLEKGWYTLDGRKLQAAPTKKGVYIVNGTKMVVR